MYAAIGQSMRRRLDVTVEFPCPTFGTAVNWAISSSTAGLIPRMIQRSLVLICDMYIVCSLIGSACVSGQRMYKLHFLNLDPAVSDGHAPCVQLRSSRMMFCVNTEPRQGLRVQPSPGPTFCDRRNCYFKVTPNGTSASRCSWRQRVQCRQHELNVNTRVRTPSSGIQCAKPFDVA